MAKKSSAQAKPADVPVDPVDPLADEAEEFNGVEIIVEDTGSRLARFRAMAAAQRKVNATLRELFDTPGDIVIRIESV